MLKTILSERHRLNRFMAAAMTRAMTMPVGPPISPPMATKMPVSTASRSPVLAKFIGIGRSSVVVPG